jgi:hypothetical protein
MVSRDGSIFGSTRTDAELADTGVVFLLRERRSLACALALAFAFDEDGMLKRVGAAGSKGEGSECPLYDVCRGGEGRK